MLALYRHLSVGTLEIEGLGQEPAITLLCTASLKISPDDRSQRVDHVQVNFGMNRARIIYATNGKIVDHSNFV